MVKIVELTDVTFFDTDCLSSFLLVGRESIILQIFEGKIKIPQVVIDELKDAEVLYNKLDIYIKRGKVEIVGGFRGKTNMRILNICPEETSRCI